MSAAKVICLFILGVLSASVVDLQVGVWRDLGLMGSVGLGFLVGDARG